MAGQAALMTSASMRAVAPLSCSLSNFVKPGANSDANRFISVPQGMGGFNCGTFVAGIVKGVLDGAGFPTRVTAHYVAVEGQSRPCTTILIKFAEEVVQQDACLG